MTEANLDALGWVYIGISIGWTVIFSLGILSLHRYRQLPCLQIRRLSLVFLANFFLHAYAIACLLGYVVAPFAPCTAEYWIMSIWLPFGMAMLQASNSQFLHIACRQRMYAYTNTLKDPKPLKQNQAESPANRWKRITQGIERADRIDRMMIFIAVGLIIQLVLALFFYFASRKFHRSYGFIDQTTKGSEDAFKSECVRGWEWWLTVFWQFFWAWIYAPYTLWRSRKIRDVHDWRIQTICCCLAGLPPSPLWLVALYVPQMGPINKHSAPSIWFAISIFFIELFTIGFPIIQVIKIQTLQQETLQALASWENRQQMNVHIDSVMGSRNDSTKSFAYSRTTLKWPARNAARKSSLDTQQSDMFTLAALENALRTNPDPLLQFAALKDFSGENVSFLTHIAEWKRKWRVLEAPFEEYRQQQFTPAVRIYACFVSLGFSEFPINISSKQMKHLESIFEKAAEELFRRRPKISDASVAPFDITPPRSSDSPSGQVLNLETLGRSNLESMSRAAPKLRADDKDSVVDVAIPDGFNAEVFDNAEEEIKYLVLTNTWPKFVNASYASSQAEREAGVRPQGKWWTRRFLCSV
ncbi:hypothetical protein CC78DRAFT_547383 [Lojkania enalia]|uniref:RGS domain-containing protein n=1 Tax=Lojkania enalia TaxID=147567 RepID=A0A9P4N3A0_9PLEO|nr:hypothetical protein CC78DRAFT_547383 [Didymosphaeria enalia]